MDSDDLATPLKSPRNIEKNDHVEEHYFPVMVTESGFLALLWLFVVDATNTKFVIFSWFLAALLPLVSA